MKAELIPLNGDPPIPITRDVTVVGRREYCDIRIDHPSLSKRHCVLVRTDGLLMLRDLITTNGTRVNGQRILWAALLPNDRLSLGGYKVRIYLGPDDVPSPSERAAVRAVPAGRASPGIAAPAGDRDDFPTPTPNPDPERATPIRPPAEDVVIELGDENLVLRNLPAVEDDEIIELD